MNDRYDENLFLGYVEGELSPEDRARFERQMALDAPLRQLVEQVLSDRQGLRELPDEAASTQIMEQVNQALERSMLFEEPSPQRGLAANAHRFRLVRWATYAAVAALVVLAGGVMVRTLSEHLEKPSGPVAGAPNKGGGLDEARHSDAERLALGPSDKQNAVQQESDSTQLAFAARPGRMEIGAGGQYARLSPEPAPSGRAAGAAGPGVGEEISARFDKAGQGDLLMEKAVAPVAAPGSSAPGFARGTAQGTTANTSGASGATRGASPNAAPGAASPLDGGNKDHNPEANDATHGFRGGMAGKTGPANSFDMHGDGFGGSARDAGGAGGGQSQAFQSKLAAGHRGPMEQGYDADAAAPFRIEIDAADPNASARDLLAWCGQNNVTVATTTATDALTLDEIVAPAARDNREREAPSKGGQLLAPPAPALGVAQAPPSGAAPGAVAAPAGPASPPAGHDQAAAKDATKTEDAKQTSDHEAAPKPAEMKANIDAARLDASAAARRNRAVGQAQQVTVLIPAEQLRPLVDHLNARANQSARVVGVSQANQSGQAQSAQLQPSTSLTPNAPAPSRPAPTGALAALPAATQPAVYGGMTDDRMAKGTLHGAGDGGNVAGAPAAAADQTRGAGGEIRGAGGGNGGGGANAAAARAKAQTETLENTDWGQILRQQLPLQETARLRDSDRELAVPVIIYERPAAK